MAKNNNKLYGAYGSNLNFYQMAYRCPFSTTYGKAIIKDYKLKFDTHLDIVPSEGDIVPIMLWNIDDRDWKRLDMYEGVKGGYYERKNIKAITEDGKEIEVIVYVMCGEHGYNMPLDTYFNTCEQGYRDCGFNIKYLNDALIEAWSNCVESEDYAI